MVFAAVVAIDAVVRAHHRPRPAALDRDFERQQVAFLHCVPRHLGIRDHPPGFLRIEREMLDRGNDVVRLDAADVFAAEHARQQRIFAQVFEIAPAPWIACQVYPACQQHVERLGARFGADHRAAVKGERRIEAGSGGHAGGQRGGGVALALFDLVGDAQAGVAGAHFGDAEARDRGGVPGRGEDVGRRAGGADHARGKQCVQQCELFVGRHRCDQRGRAVFGAAGGVGPGRVRARILGADERGRGQDQGKDAHGGAFTAGCECAGSAIDGRAARQAPAPRSGAARRPPTRLRARPTDRRRWRPARLQS